MRYALVMAFGFPAYHQEDVPLPMPITEDWIAYACRAAGLGVARGAQGPEGWTWRIVADVSLASWGEDMSIVALGPQHLRVRSQCSLPTQCIDWGKNKKNVQRFVTALLQAMGASQGAPFR